MSDTEFIGGGAVALGPMKRFIAGQVVRSGTAGDKSLQKLILIDKSSTGRYYNIVHVLAETRP